MDISTLTLKKIQEEILSKNVCSELAKMATQLVFGSGNPNASVVFIGEAPGKKEDLSGEPFVGASGKILNQMLESIGLSRKDVYITNIVKYKPPENRDPTPKEKKEFKPYLEAQLQAINPTIIATLGRHAMNTFLPENSISEAHGKLHRLGTWNIFPLYHPAAIIYNQHLKSIFAEDFKKLKELL